MNKRNQVARSVPERTYTVFGFADQSAIPDTLLGFTGQYCQLSGVYLLGNGYRAYSPVLMRFCSPDRFSPFGRGGINTYSYCGNDPVNYTDPSGGMRWPRWLKKRLTRLTGLSNKVKTHEKGRGAGYQEGHVAGVDKGYAGGKAVGNLEGYAVGRRMGRKAGYAAGRRVNLDEGYAAGHRVGLDKGYAAGHRVGLDKGFDGGYSVGHRHGVEATSNGTIKWQEWMKDPAIANQTPRQALNNAILGVEPYLMARYYDGTTSGGVSGILYNIFMLSKGIRLPGREDRDYYINELTTFFPDLKLSQ